MELHLVEVGPDAWLGRQQLVEKGNGDVGEANVPHQTQIHHLLHPLPRFHQRHVRINVLTTVGIVNVLVAVPAPHVQVGTNVYMTKRHGPVHQIQIEIIQTKIGKGLAESLLDVLAFVKRTGQFGNDKEIGSLQL